MSSFESKLRESLGIVPSPALTTLMSKEYTDSDILKNQTYKFNRPILNNEDLINLSNKFYKDLVNEFPSRHTAKTLLLLAMNLRKTEDIDDTILKPHKSVSPKDVDVTEAGVERKERVSITSQDPQSSKSSDDDIMQQIDSAMEHEKIIDEKPSEIKATSRNLPFAPFFAAYLMKCTIKQVQNVSLGVKHMLDRYLGFYPEMECPRIDITTPALTSLQNKLKFDKTMLNTWIFTTADYEHDADVTSVDAGVVRYLANLQFSFSAMPAYNLFRELLLVTNGDPAGWIIKLWTDSTKKTLAEIHNILVHHESIIEGKATKKRSKYFKYARALDPQYFLRLQPGQSLCLIYLLARVLHHYQNYTALSNPDKIAVLSRMGEKQKGFLKVLASVLVDSEGEVEGESTRYAQIAREKYKAERANEEVEDAEKDILKAMEGEN